MKHIEYFKIFESSYDYTKIFSEIDRFLKGAERNKWISDDSMEIYIRKSKRFIEGELRDFFDFATINLDESIRGQKVFTNLLDSFIRKYPHNIYVESIQSPAVTHIIKKFGFKETELDNSCMYLIR
jgi:hypothetical protein